MISPEEKMRILRLVESAVTTARADSELYRYTEADPALKHIWRTLWLATDLISAALRDCTRELSKPLVEVERREPEAFSGMLDAEIDRLRAALEEIGGCDCKVAPANHGKPCGICITCIARSALAGESKPEHVQRTRLPHAGLDEALNMGDGSYRP